MDMKRSLLFNLLLNIALAIDQFNRSMGEIASKSFLFCPGQIHVSGLRVQQFQITKVNQGKNAKLIGT